MSLHFGEGVLLRMLAGGMSEVSCVFHRDWSTDVRAGGRKKLVG